VTSARSDIIARQRARATRGAHFECAPKFLHGQGAVLPHLQMSSATGTTARTPEDLRRQLGLGSAAAVVAGEAIAVGIFLTPAGMAKSLASPFWLLIVWLAVGAMTLSGALCYGELAGRFPSAGGAYVYLRECFGPRTAFLYGWMCLLVLDPGLTAAFATGFAAYAAYIFHWPPLIIKFSAIVAIWAICILNIFSTRISAGFLRWITWLKFAVLAVLTVWALVFRLGSWSNFVPFVAQRPGALPLAPALGAAVVGAFFSFGGWWDAHKNRRRSARPGPDSSARARGRRSCGHFRVRHHQRRLHLSCAHRKSRL
jgi:basic amino acid/polyamine antiporter, APA family